MNNLRRRMAENSPLNCRRYTFNINYVDIDNRVLVVAIDGVIVYNIGIIHLLGDTFDFGDFVVTQIPQVIADAFRVTPKRDYIFRGQHHLANTSFDYNLHDVVVDELLIPEEPPITSIYYTLKFDYNGGGASRSVVTTFCDLFTFRETFQDLSGLGIFNRLLYDITFVRVVDAVDYYAIQARRQFTCDGVTYTPGQSMSVPWVDPVSTIITKELYFSYL